MIRTNSPRPARAVARSSILLLSLPFAIGCFPNAIEKQQKTPEGALTIYLRSADIYLSEERGNRLEELKQCVTKDDWEWFNNNYQKISGDPFGLSLVPLAAQVVGRRSAMETILYSGPCGDEYKVVDSQVDGKQATLRIKRLYGRGGYKVSLKKEWGYWKVADFAGGRSRVNRWFNNTGGSIDPGDDGTGTASALPGILGGTASDDSGTSPPLTSAANAAAGGASGGGRPAGAKKIDAAAMADAERFLKQARADWDMQLFGRSIMNARKALAIYRKELPADDARIDQVQRMIRSAEKEIELREEADGTR